LREKKKENKKKKKRNDFAQRVYGIVDIIDPFWEAA
jgi:hypothetical protein